MSRQSLIISVLFRVLAALIAAPVALLAPNADGSTNEYVWAFAIGGGVVRRP